MGVLPDAAGVVRLLAGPGGDLAEDKASPAHAVIFALVKAVEPGGPVGHIRLDFVELGEDAHFEDLLAEIAFIQLPIQNLRIKPLQLAQGKLAGQELKDDGHISDLAPQPLTGRLQNAVGVKRQVRYVLDFEPGRVAGIRRRTHRRLE